MQTIPGSLFGGATTSNVVVGSGVVHTAGRGLASVESMMSAESGSTAPFMDRTQFNSTASNNRVGGQQNTKQER